MKIIQFKMNSLEGDSKFYSDKIAIMLGQTDANKNYYVTVDNIKGIVEVQFNHTDKAGWSNKTNWNNANEITVKNAMTLMVGFNKILAEGNVL